MPTVLQKQSRQELIEQHTLERAKDHLKQYFPQFKINENTLIAVFDGKFLYGNHPQDDSIAKLARKVNKAFYGWMLDMYLHCN